MMDIDIILSMMGNPTRRRILEELVREPQYPFQLSKGLGISQQAVMKNLALMEKNGIIVSYQESSKIGPNRAMYVPSSEFTIVIDMRTGMFSTAINSELDTEEEIIAPNLETLEEIRGEIRAIDKEIETLEKERLAQIRKRQQMISWAMSKLNDERFVSDHRNLMYQILNKPNEPIEEIISEMSDKKGIEKKVNEIANAMQE